MTFIGFTVVAGENVQNVSAFYENKTYSTDGTNPNYARIVAGLSETPQDVSVLELFSVEKAVAAKFDKLSDRVSVANGAVYFDMVPVHSVLTDHIVRFLEEGAPFGPLVNLLENLMQNMEDHARENLYLWMQNEGLVTDELGYIIGYKGVRRDENTGELTSINTSGSAIVDGERHTGGIPNHVGAIIEMPRDEVEFDPARGCSTGLHVGTWDYASNFAQGAVLKVKVHPRDVVSVPTDCNGQKMRVCRYEVLEVTETQIPTAYFGDFTVTDDDIDDYDCNCDSCRHDRGEDVDGDFMGYKLGDWVPGYDRDFFDEAAIDENGYFVDPLRPLDEVNPDQMTVEEAYQQAIVEAHRREAEAQTVEEAPQQVQDDNPPSSSFRIWPWSK
jgi:hypothetical protein